MAEPIESAGESANPIPPEQEPVNPSPESSGAETAPKKRRGRPPGSGTKKSAEQIEAGNEKPGAAKPGKRKAASFDSATIAMMGKQLAGMHQIAFMATGIPEVVISEAEGIMLAQGICNVCEQYNLSIDGKTGATLQLAFTAAAIYGPRALSVRARAMRAQAQQAQSGEQTGGQNGAANVPA